MVQLMRINLLKRMESSIESFRLSVERLLYNINNVLDKIDNGIDYNPNINIDIIIGTDITKPIKNTFILDFTPLTR